MQQQTNRRKISEAAKQRESLDSESNRVRYTVRAGGIEKCFDSEKIRWETGEKFDWKEDCLFKRVQPRRATCTRNKKRNVFLSRIFLSRSRLINNWKIGVAYRWPYAEEKRSHEQHSLHFPWLRILSCNCSRRRVKSVRMPAINCIFRIILNAIDPAGSIARKLLLANRRLSHYATRITPDKFERHHFPPELSTIYYKLIYGRENINDTARNTISQGNCASIIKIETVPWIIKNYVFKPWRKICLKKKKATDESDVTQGIKYKIRVIGFMRRDYKLLQLL